MEMPKKQVVMWILTLEERCGWKIFFEESQINGKRAMGINRVNLRRK